VILFCPRCGTELASRFKGEWWSTDEACQECGVALADPPATLSPSDDEIAYTLDEWPSADRASITNALIDRALLYRWEPGVVLVVPLTAERAVDAVLDDVEDASDAADFDAAAGEDDGSEEVQEAMGELFVAADRLPRAASDVALLDEVVLYAEVIVASNPPYGIEPQVWERLQALARDLVANVQAGAPEDTISDAGRAVRDYLRPYV
jgi:hypothetical protein